MRTVTAKTLVQMGDYCRLTPKDFETSDGEVLVNELTFYGTKLSGGYTVIGEATITMTIFDKDQLIESKVAQLKEVLQKTQADAEVACNRIRDQINSLLCIEHKAE